MTASPRLVSYIFVLLQLLACGRGLGALAPNQLALATGATASFAVVQDDLPAPLPNAGSRHSGRPLVGSEGLLLADTAYNRLLSYAPLPGRAGARFRAVIGQPDAIRVVAGSDRGSFHGPTAISSDGQHLLIADPGNDRVLVFIGTGLTPGAQALRILGQGDSSHGCTSSTLKGPSSAIIVGNFLAVADSGNNRVLMWLHFPTSDNIAADVVIGQPNMTTCTPTFGPQAMNQVSDIFFDNQHLVVASPDNGGTVQLWRTLPTLNALPSNTQLTHIGAGPLSLTANSSQLFVADAHTNRVFIYNDFFVGLQPPSQPSAVLGQPNAQQTGAGSGLAEMAAPQGLTLFGQQLWVNDAGNNRLLVF